MSNLPGVIDKRDYWTFQLDANTYIQSIKLVKYDNSSYVAGVGGGGFFGVAKASQITAVFPTNPIGNLIGGALIGVAPGVQAGDELLDNLPFDQRTVIVLREIEGLSYEEIAEVMNCPIGTVRSRIFRAREAIAQRLRPVLQTRDGERW